MKQPARRAVKKTLKKLIIGSSAGLILMALLFLLLVMAIAATIVPGSGNAAQAAPLAPTGLAAADIPADMLGHYQQAANQYCQGTWHYLAAIGKVETGHGSNKNVSSKGARGPMQFLAATWVGWKYDVGGGRVDPNLDIGDLGVIARGGGYGTDANGDGRADILDPADATAAAAKLLCGNGAPGNMRRALFTYNRDWGYVNLVEGLAVRYSQLDVPAEPPSLENPPADTPVARGSYVLPVERHRTSIGILSLRHHDYPASDIRGIPIGAPVFAATSGTVIETVESGYGGGRGLAVVIRGDDGYQYDYWHGSRVIADHGQRVAAGQLIMLLGNTGHSTGPHLHFGITRPGGGKICPQSLLVDWFNFVATPPSGSTPSTGCIGPSLRGR